MKQVMTDADSLLTKKDVANWLQCSMRQVELLAARGRLPRPVYIGEASPRWRRSDLNRYIDELASKASA